MRQYPHSLRQRTEIEFLIILLLLGYYIMENFIEIEWYIPEWLQEEMEWWENNPTGTQSEFESIFG